MRKRFIVSLYVAFFTGVSLCQGAESLALFDVKAYGGVGDGVAMETDALQRAIDACARQGGGAVVVPKGMYQTGTLWLKSHVELRLLEGAELLGSLDLADYSDEVQCAIEAPAFDECLLYAERAENLKITGSGTINGRGASDNFPINLSDGTLGDRPMLIRFVECQNIEFRDVTFKDAGSWCTHLVDCDDIVIQNLTIDSHVNKNNDGIDLDGCKNVLIENCTIRSGDDSICPKSTTTRICENIVVRNCRAASNTSAFKLGTSSRGGFRDITVSDCDFSDTRMGAIKLLAVDGGFIENICISNIVMNNVEGPIFIRLANRGRKYDVPTEQIQAKDVKPEGVPVGYVKDIHIRNVQATVTGDVMKRQGMMISGIPGHCIENVLLEDIDVSFVGGGRAEDALREVDEDIARYPEQFFFGVLPSYGAYVRHAKNVVFKNVNLTTRTPDQRPRVITVDVDGFVEQ